MSVRLLTLDEVAERLSISRRTVEREVARGSLASCKVRGARRVSEQALRAFVDRVEMPATGDTRRSPRTSQSAGRLGEGPDPLVRVSRMHRDDGNG